MDDTDYHRMRAFNSSGAKLILKSPMHFWSERLDPNRVEPEPTLPMMLGTAIHYAVLEPDLFAMKVAVMPDDAPDKRSKSGREWHAGFAQQVKDMGARIVLSAADAARARAAADAVLAHPAATALLADTAREHTAIWVDRETGVDCKARLDAMKRDRRAIVDLKTTDDARPDAFARSILNFGMHIQAAFYIDAVRSLGIAPGREPDPAYAWIVVETKPPHGVRIYRAHPRMIERGRDLFRRAIRIYAECVANDDWPGYPDTITEIDLPPWGYRDRPDADDY